MIEDSTQAFTTNGIINKIDGIHFIFHDEDGDWHFMPNKTVSESEARIVSIGELLKLDFTAREALTLPIGHMLERSGENLWIRKKIS